MKKTILYTAAAFGLLISTHTFAQQQKPAASAKPAATTKPTPQAKRITPEQRAEHITTSMVKNLGLNSAQTAKVRQINLQSVNQMEEARIKHQKNPRAMVDQADLISQSRLSRLKDVLSPDQFNKYQRKREQEMGITQPASPNTPRSPESQSYGE